MRPARAAAPVPGAGGRWGAYLRLVRLDKPIGILLLLWPTLDALWFAASGWPGWRDVAVFVAGTTLMRSAGCAFNDVVDRDIDGRVERTAGRPLARGELGVRQALAAAALLAALAAALLPLLDAAATPLALVALVVAASYPFFKRFFFMPQACLGIAFSLGIPMAYAAVLGSVPLRAWLLLGANLFWVLAYDTEYAMVDRRDDLLIGVRSSAIWFGQADVAAVAACYAIYLLALAALARAQGCGLAFAIGWLVAVLCAGAHVWWIRGRDPRQCLRAFRHNHWLGLSIFAGVVADFLVRGA